LPDGNSFSGFDGSRYQNLSVSSEEDRRWIGQEFMVYRHTHSDAEIAEELGVSMRTVKRLRTSKRAPQKEAASKMLKSLRAREELMFMNDAQLASFLEQRRRKLEQHQREIQIEARLDSSIYLKAPSWYKLVQEYMKTGRFEEAAEELVDRLSPAKIGEVSEELLPYALNKQGLAECYCGRVNEGVEALRKAIDSAQKAGMSNQRISNIQTNLAGMLLRMNDPDEALQQVELSLSRTVAHLPAYYTALCAANFMRSDLTLAVWVGRTLQVTKMLGRVDELEQFVHRMSSDPDLEWARKQTVWTELDQNLRAIAGSNGK